MTRCHAFMFGMLARSVRQLWPVVASASLRRGVSSEQYRRVDWSTPALKYLRYIGVDMTSMMRLYERLGKTKYFTRDRVADLVEFFDHVGMRGSVIKDAIICAPDLLRVPLPILEARVCWYRDIFEYSHQEFRFVMELYPNLLEDKSTQRFEEALQYFKQLGLRREDYRAMLLKCPTILQNSIQDSIDKTIQYFLERGVAKEAMVRAILRYPELLNFSLMGHILPKAHYFETEMEISNEEFAQVFVHHGWVLGLNLESEIRHTVQWLLDFGASKAALGRVILKFPPILGYSVENNFKPKLDYLIHYLGIPFAEVAKLIEDQPGFVGASLKEHIRPFVWCLEHELSMPFRDIGGVFVGAPAVFGLSFNQTIRPTIQYFVDVLGCRKEAFVEMLKHFPQILCYSLESTIQPKIQWLEETVGLTPEHIKEVALHRLYPYTTATLNNKLKFVRSQLDVGHEEMVRMLCADASFLHKSLSNLAAKIRFLEARLGKERLDVVQCPEYLGFSLAARIRPRTEFLLSLEKNVAALTLKEMFVCSDATFAASIAQTSLEQFGQFKEALRDAEAPSGEEEKFEETLLEATFVQEADVVQLEEIREAERRFNRKFKYQSVWE